jgi:PAS domain S-box-containing protein
VTWLQRLLPGTLVGRVFALYVASLLLFVVSGLGLFYRYQFVVQVEEELLAGEMMINVAAQTVGDSAVIGDYDTIARTLEHAIDRSNFAKAQFIDTKGGVITASNPDTETSYAPAWLRSRLQQVLFDINHNISVGGNDYGVLRLKFADAAIAGKLWRVAMYAMALAVAALVVGGFGIYVPLKRWLGNFDRVRVREAEILSGAVNINALIDSDAPEEIRHTFDILHRAAERLLAQREEASVTLNAIADGVLTTDASYRLVYCNPAAEQMLGVRGQSVIGQDAKTLLPMAFADEDNPADWRVRKLELVMPGGTPAVLDTTLSTIYSASHEVAGHVLAFRDITQQHQLDQQLRGELQMRQRALESLRRILDTYQTPANTAATPLAADDLDAMSARVASLMSERELSRRALDNQKFALDQHAIVSMTDLQGRITYANDRFCDISGYSRSELLGANHSVVNAGVHPAAMFVEMWGTITAGHVWHGEVCNRKKDGTLYWVDATIVPLAGADGLPEQYIAIRTDISVRKAFEAQLAEQLQFVEVLLEATPTAIYLKDVQGRYMRFNRAFEALFGVERDDWIGKNVFDLMPADVAEMMHAKDQELFQTGQTQSYEAPFTQRKTGQVRDALYWKAPLTDASGKITALVGTILDITDRNRIEQELRDAKRSAEAASQAKSDFLANMSHEIRTPMNGVIGMTDLALGTTLDATQREYLSIVKSSAQSLMVILNDILDFSKIEAGKLNIEAVEFPLPDWISETLKTLVARADSKGLALQSNLAPNLPVKVVGDPVRMRQVLTNLCDNAIKFTGVGGVYVDVQSVPLEHGESELQFSVRDTGIGIPSDKQQGIFEAFTQADTSTTRQYGGTGLGLTICARLVGLMGGRIWVDSVPDMGSTFHFSVRVETVGESAPAVEATAVEPVSGLGQSLKVLLVEDHPINQMLATTLLKKWGHTVVLAENGQEGVDLFPSQAWDLVLMDMQMPVMGGLEATRLIRASEAPGQRTPIVAMTANAMESDRQACLDAGMDDHLAKPFNSSDLQTILAHYARQS